MSKKQKGNKVSIFFKQVQEELKQVTWPSREQTIKMTGVVILVSVLIGLYLGGLDYIFTRLMGFIIA